MRLPVTLTVHPSRTLAIWLASFAALAAAALASTSVPLWLMLAGLIGVALWVGKAIRPQAYRALVLGSDGTVGLIGKDGGETAGRVHASTTVFSWLVVLRLTTASGLLSMVCPKDAFDADGHRQLRLWLRQKASGEAQE